MPPEPLPWDRKDFFKERKRERSETTSSSFGGGSTPRWREFSYSSSNHYGSSRDVNRWGPHDFRRPPGHGKQGAWHMLAEESGHMYAPYRSNDKILEDENCRPFLRGDGRFGRNNRENRGYFSQRDWRGSHSWETSNGSSNMPGRQHDVSNDHRSVDEMLTFPPSHPAHSDFVNSWDQHQLKDQRENNKMGGVNGLGTGQRGDREIPLDWKPLKWIRSGSLSSRGSGFSHSSCSKSLGVVDSNEGRAELQPKNATPVHSLSGDVATCVTSAAPSEEISSRKKARLGWGEGLAKYEKKKVESPVASGNKDGPVVSASNVVSIHSQTSNLAEMSPRVMGFSDCASPATPSSVACSSSPGLEEKTFVKSTNADNARGSPSIASQSHIEGLSFNLEKMDVTNLGSSLAELLQSDDPSSVDSFVRSTAMNKLLVWKGDLSKSLELTESEIDSLENELKSLKFESGNRCPCPAASSPSPSEGDAKPCNVQGVASNSVPRPSPLQVASRGDEIVEKVSFCNGELEEVHADVKDDDIDSPGTATSKLAEPVSLARADSSTNRVKDDFDALQSARVNLKGVVPCADEEETGIFACEEDLPSGDEISDTHGEDNLCNLILASNKESASRSSEVFNKLLPSEQCRFDFSRASNGSSWQSDALVVQKFAARKQLLRFKERAVTLKFKAFHHLWKEDMRLLSIRKYRAKSQKKWELSLRTTQSGYQKHRSSIRARFSSPAGNLSLVPTTEILNFTSKLLSDSQVKLYRNALKMPALILDKKEKIASRFISSNGLVEDPCAVEKERAMINPWTSDEKEIFMHKLATFGKDFQKIASFLDHKSTADCVEFYYKNHKSDCFEKTKKSKQTKPSTNYLVASSSKWNRELNAASLDILGAASLMAVGTDHAMNSRPLCSSRIFPRGNCNSKITEGDDDGMVEGSSSFDVFGSERETVAADVLAGICGSVSSEAMSSCITTSVDLVEGYQEWKCQKVDSVVKPLLTSDAMQNFDEETCSDESCGEMDPTDWTDEEKSIFIQAVSSYGKDFAMISRVVRTRTRDQCKVFFSKARKCLGLDLIHPGPKKFGTPVRDDVNGGGTDTENACAIETGSAICSDKLDSKIDEDLPSSAMNTEHNESDAEGRIRLRADLNGTEDNNASERLDQNDSKIVEKMVSDPSEAGQRAALAFAVDSKVMNSVNQLESVQAQKVLIVSTNAESESDQAADKSLSIAEVGPVVGVVGASTSNANTAVELKAVATVFNDGMENGFMGRELLLPENSLCSPSGLIQDSTSNASFHPVNLDSCSDAIRGSENMHKVSVQLESVEKPPVISLPQENDLAVTVSLVQDSAVIQYEKKHEQDTLQDRGDKQRKTSVCRDDYFQHLSGSPVTSQNDSSQILRGYPLLIPAKKEMNGDISSKPLSEARSLPNSEKNVTSQFEAQDCYLQKCSSSKAQHSVSELPFLSQHTRHGSDHPRDHSWKSSGMEKPCRNGDVKLFGKILSNPLQKQNSSARENGENDVPHLKPTGKSANLKLTGHHPSEGNVAFLKCDRNNQLGLENFPMRSRGFWDGNRTQTGLPDSAALLAKYPAAFSNYPVSSKMPQQTLQSVVKTNECNLKGMPVFPAREVGGSNGVVDYQVHRSHDSTGGQPFTVDMKQREDIFVEMQRLNGQQSRGMVGMNVVGRGGILVGGPCTGVSDPVVAIKRHYAKADQYGGQNGIVFREEESWIGKGDIGR